MKMVMTTGAIRCAKLQPKCHRQQTNSRFFSRPAALPVTQPEVSKHLRESFCTLNMLKFSSAACVFVTAAEKTEQRRSEEAFLKAARDGNHEAVTTMVLSTVSMHLTDYCFVFTFQWFDIIDCGMTQPVRISFQYSATNFT